MCIIPVPPLIAAAYCPHIQPATPRVHPQARRPLGAMSDSTSIHSCLAAIGLGVEELRGCTNLTEEFTTIKRAYFKKVLIVHPDKGGNAEEFRDVNTSFELIRSLFEKKAVSSFANDAEARDEWNDFDDDVGPSPAAQPWQYYYDAAEEEVPPYRMEPARSGRSKCSQKTKSAKRCSPSEPFIPKGDIRIGSLDGTSGSYGRWVHLACWRVPSRIWQGLPVDVSDRDKASQFEASLAAMNEVQFCGFDQLTPDQKWLVVLHVMDEGNWASRGKRKGSAPRFSNTSGTSATPQSQPRGAGDLAYASTASSGGGHSAYAPMASSGAGHSAYDPIPSSGGTAVSLVGERAGFFVVPSPGVNGAQPGFLRGKTVVMTGIFPEIGGGAGLNQGKDRVRQMCESFGARVTSAVSGKTDLLIVGREPGMSKVGKASARENCQLVSLADLARSIEGKQQLNLTQAPEIDTFSSGYNGNGLRALPGGPARKAFKSATTKTARKKSGAKRSTKTGAVKALRVRYTK